MDGATRKTIEAEAMISEDKKEFIKIVSWLVFQMITVGAFLKYTPLEKWLWQ